MSREVLRYTFKTSVPVGEVEGTFLLAVLAAEGLHGQSRVRIETTYSFDPKKRVFLIDADSLVGRDICLIFTGLAIREFGETSFRVRHSDGARDRQKDGVPA